jgi:ferredoxin-fold anticodon binding domain-containing protein
MILHWILYDFSNTILFSTFIISSLYPECFIQCVLLQRGANGQSIYVKKRNFRMWSEDELRKMVTPELVSNII